MNRIVYGIVSTVFLISISALAFGVAKVPLIYAADIINSDQTWKGNIIIGASQNVVVKDCTITVVDGNITVYGNLTLENVHLIIRTVSRSGYLSASAHGNLTIYNLTVSGPLDHYIHCSGHSKVVIYEFLPEVGDEVLVAADNSEVKIYNSYFGNIESRNASKLEIHNSTIGAFETLPMEDISLNSHAYSKVKIYRSTIRGKILVHGNSELSALSSTVENVECRDSSMVMITGSNLSHASVYDGSALFLEEILGMMTDVDAYSSSFSPCPRADVYNCSLNAVRVWGEGHSALNIAHSTINYLQTRGHTTLTFDNMTVTGEWTHNGTLVGCRRVMDHIGNFCIEWGETYAKCTLKSTSNTTQGALTTYTFTADRIREEAVPPEPIPPNLLYTGNFVNITLQRKFEGKEVEIELLIYYTDEQVENMEPSTLKIYSFSPDIGWNPLRSTGVNETGKYVWGTLTFAQEKFNMYFVALGTPKSVEPPPNPAMNDEPDWWTLAPYIVSASIVVIAAAATAVYLKRVKSKKA